MKLNAREKKLLRFYYDMKNWHPPYFSEMMAHVGYKSKASITKFLEKIRKAESLVKSK